MRSDKALRAARRTERILVDGRWIHPDAKHGTSTGYVYFGCQCELCATANTKRQRIYNENRKAKRAAEKASPLGDWVHDWIDDIAKSTPNRKPLPVADLRLARLLREEMAA